MKSEAPAEKEPENSPKKRGRPFGSKSKQRITLFPSNKASKKRGRPFGSSAEKAGLQRVDVQQRLIRLNCDPIQGLAMIVRECESDIDTVQHAIIEETDAYKKSQLIKQKTYHLRQIIEIYKELAQYIAPKLKSISVEGPDGGPVQVDTTWNVNIISKQEIPNKIIEGIIIDEAKEN